MAESYSINFFYIYIYVSIYTQRVLHCLAWSLPVTGQKNGSNGKTEHASGKSVFLSRGNKQRLPSGLISHENKGNVFREPHTAPWSVSSHTQHQEAALISLNYVITKFLGWSYGCLQFPVAGDRMFHCACEEKRLQLNVLLIMINVITCREA